MVLNFNLQFVISAYFCEKYSARSELFLEIPNCNVATHCFRGRNSYFAPFHFFLFLKNHFGFAIIFTFFRKIFKRLL